MATPPNPIGVNSLPVAVRHRFPLAFVGVREPRPPASGGVVDGGSRRGEGVTLSFDLGRHTQASVLVRALVIAVLLWVGGLRVSAQGTGFTYQGRLTESGVPANGLYEFVFSLHDALVGGNQFGPLLQINSVAVSNGVFTVLVDFGAAALFEGTRCLQIGVRPSAALEAFSPLTPRQALTPVPTALYALTGPPVVGSASGLTNGTLADARLSANVPLLQAAQLFTGDNTFAGVARLTNALNQIVGNFTGTFAGNGTGLTHLPAASLTGTLPAARLPANVAYKDTDLAALSLQVSARQQATEAAVTALFTSLAVQIYSVSDQLNTVSNQIHLAAPAGLTVASTDLSDATLLGLGYRNIATLAGPAWTTSAAANSPSARHAHSAVWTGQDWIVWGGEVDTGIYTASGGRYRPATDAWTTMITVDAPAARFGHAAVWTGNEMIIWGGFTAGGYANTGGRYSLSQAWTPVSTVGAPVRRSGQVAVWTGSRMLVWGGRDTSGALDSGALYSPTTDTWSSLLPANPPAARFGAAAAWTGDRLIVWGGEDGSGALGSGAQLRFDPSGTPAEWLPMSLTNAPSPRSGHAAVWTGTKFIVWGGSQQGAALNDGAVYDPAANTWQPMSVLNAPSARSRSAAVWTGTEVLVFGGESGGVGLANGAAYEPVANQWRPLSTTGNPLARSEGAAVWTGAELILFGGRAGGQFVGSLQRLDPQPTWHLFRKP